MQVGPTGSGKTLLARAVAGEIHDIPFYMTSGHEVLLQLKAGYSPLNYMFDHALKFAPAVIYIEEVRKLYSLSFPARMGIYLD